jgi:hypothetical protein
MWRFASESGFGHKTHFAVHTREMGFLLGARRADSTGAAKRKEVMEERL